MPEGLDIKYLWVWILIIILMIAVIILLIWGLLRLNKFIFRRIQSKHEGLHLLFFERLSGAVILIGGITIVLSMSGGFNSVIKTLLGGTAIVSAVAAFAAQDILKDILAGLMISIHKPFEVGNRIELEDGTTGIVKDMTMRHVVLLSIDTQYVIVPNSKLNMMKIRNYSYHAGYRSADFNFYIGYNSDVEKAMHVIKDAVISSEYSVPGKLTAQGPEYADVYFMAYEESSLKMRTTVYFESTTPSEVLITDINTKVNLALKENGIEIPYNYINVIQKTPQE